MPQAPPTKEQVEQSGIPIQGAKLTSLRPTIHPPTQPRPKDKTLPAPAESPPLHHIFAEAFSRLPSVHSYMAGFCKTGRELYHYLFSGTPPLPFQADATDDPMGATPAFDPVAAAHEVTVFSQMVDECIDIPASFDDPRRLSAPEIQASDNVLTTLTIATPTTPSFSGLVQHLYDQLYPYLSTKQTETTTLNAFVTFVVGPPDHPNARYALHSHLVGCHTTFNSDLHVDYSTIYVPIGVGQPWSGPEEWGPLIVFLAAGLLWPDLSFLVCHPRLLLGAHAPLDELREVFATDCPLVLFSSASAIARSDVLYHPGRVSKFANDPPFTCNDEPFRHNSPDHVKQLISSSVSEHAAGSAACRQAMVPHSVEADLHLPLFCTPYYGFVPSTEVDLLVEILQLSSFLCTCCFSSAGEGLSQLGDSLPTASALLSMLSAIPNERPGGGIAVFPGTGVFICDPAPPPQQGDLLALYSCSPSSTSTKDLLHTCLHFITW